MAEVKQTKVEALQAALTDTTLPIAKRMRTVFLLKQVGTEAAIDALGTAIFASSILLAHEAAYAIGQLGMPYAVPLLIKAVENTDLDAIVRHEAAEAIGAIQDDSGLEVLQRYKDDPCVELAETCQIALAKFAEAKPTQTEEEKAAFLNTDSSSTANPNSMPQPVTFHSVDPATPHPSTDVDFLSKALLDVHSSLYARYKAMFALRNLNTEASVLALCSGFNDSSSLFKHEICYVLGQMAHLASMPALAEVMQDEAQHPMVRHEAAEALGNIDHPDVRPLLEKCQKDNNAIVRESCDVGLDISEYWTSDQFDTVETQA